MVLQRNDPGRRARIAAERLGRLAETLCVWSLRLRGWRILERRLAARRGQGIGEIDIIAKRGRVVAFIEVKARGTSAAALEAVTGPQRARIARAPRYSLPAFRETRPATSDLT